MPPKREWFWLEKRMVIWPLIAVGRLVEWVYRRVARRRHRDIIERRARRIGRK